ncbi:MAG: Gfo/Idh/MocA family oxidoreductase [Planctomyces sp.]|nr:Gfo/Idh/MocA family oxidoreductase [Planctomyces sp.]
MSASNDTPNASRRSFLQTSSAASAGALLAGFAAAPRVFAQSEQILKIGLVGCGGRGTGAAADALQADNYTRLVALGDVFPEQINYSLDTLKNQKEIGDRVQVEPGMKFVGLDAYQKVIENVDVVLLASPPGFRPWHLRAAVEAGKHVFCEKPMATDGPGVRHAMESVRMSQEKNLGLVAGFCWRYEPERRALFNQIHSGAIGDVRAIYGTYLTGPVKPMMPEDQRPAGITDLEWMVRNWYNFTFLSGDGLVEQAVHTVDWLQWVMRDEAPVSCTAVGGRQIPAIGGNIFDHIEVNYLWENGIRGFLAQRQITGCHNENRLTVIGSKGIAEIGGRGVQVSGETNWRYRPAAGASRKSMYQIEHDELFLSIRDGKPLNDGDRMMKSTLAGIMGRMAGYTGQEVTWDKALHSEEQLIPEITSWDTPVVVPGVALPGTTPLL